MSSKRNAGLTRRASGLMALEPRYMFDGAAVDTAHDQLADTTTLQSSQPVAPDLIKMDASTSSLTSAAQLAQQQVRDYLASSTDAQLFALFNGGKAAPDDGWMQRLGSLREALSNGSFAVNVVAMDSASQFTALAAFSAQGPNGQPTIFINTFWFGMFDAPDTSRALIEELGHAFDAYLNPNADTSGDEGEAFADTVIDGPLSQGQSSALLTQNDHGQVVVNGVSYEVEFASLNFSNAYEMVYDQDNDTASTAVTTAAIDVTERWADKEQNSHYFNASVSLGVTSLTDGTGNQNFSGNDVSGAVAVTVGGNTYYGWVSRPIKSGGIVRGFYFWTDDRFNNNGSAAANLAAAQADGNQDGDSSVLNNRGFLLVVDQAWFDSQISSTGVTKTINNNKDGNDGTITVANVGSSSDRVDSALNSVIPPNSEPTVANDTLTVAEDSGTTTVSAANGLLSNDSDVNHDTLTITGYTISGVSGTQTVGSTVTISGVGDIHINADGSYTFAPVANYTGSVPPITYTVSDGNGGTTTAVLSITVTPVNDPPISTDDSVNVAINTPKLLGVNDFGTYSDPESDPFTSVKITALPTTGTLEYWNGTFWTTLTGTPTVSITDILQGNLRYVPATNTTGSPTLQFQVYDGGLYSTSSYTLTLNIAGNIAPSAISDTNAIAEAGCGVTAAPALGNVITDGTDDSDADGGTLVVTGINAYGTSQSVSSGTNSSNGTSINGQYGTLSIGANGAYSYVLNNSLSTIDAMNSGDTKTETFTYTVSDGQGGTASTTLTITINGTNDDPIARDDFSSLQEGALSGGNYGTVSGNALTNDTDVDNSTLSIAGSFATATGSAQGTASYSFTTSSAVGSGDYVFFDDDGADNTKTVVSSNTATTGEIVALTVRYNGASYAMQVNSATSGATTFKIVVNSQTISVELNDNEQGFSFSNGTYVGFASVSNAATGTYKVSAISGTTSPSSTTVNITGLASGEIAAGMTVTDGSITRTVQSVNKDSSGTVTSVVLNTAVAWDAASLTFSSSASPLLLTGKYGNISINTTTGAYTYTLTSNTLNDGEIFNEKFSYRATDGSCTDDATITIRIAGASAPYLRNDTLIVSEDSGSHISFNGSTSGSDSVKTNDANGTVTLGDVTSFKIAGDSNTYLVGSNATISGVGVLTINADGTISFDPMDNYVGPVPTITYTRTGSDSLAYTANLTITIDPVNDASVLTADTKTILEDGSGTGNVLVNDSDSDNSLSVASYTWNNGSTTVSGSVGNPTSIILNGVTVGSLTLNTDGTYTFTPSSNSNGSVPTITYTTNTGSSSTLDITVTPVNDPPTLDLDDNGAGTGWSAAYTNQGTSVSIGDTDVVIADIDDTNIESAVIVLTNPQSGDVLNIGGSSIALTTSGTMPSGTLSNGIAYTTSNTSGVITISLSGSYSLASYQDAIKAITFSSSGTSTVDRVVSVKVNDGDADSNTAYTTIDVGADNRLVTVMGTAVNEASPYVVFEVTGVQNQWISLNLGTTGSGTGHASMGTDFLPNLEYLVGSTWTSYTGGMIQIVDAGGKLLVRTAVLQDTLFESTQNNYETLKLTAKNAAGTSNVTTDGANFLADGTARIRDDGQGDIYLSGNTTFTPSTPLTYLDDDRPVTVNSIVVNEASPYAVLTISGYNGQVLNLAWTDLTAKKDANSSGALDGTDDYGPLLQYWDPTANSNVGGWVDYNSSVTMSGSSLFVRTSIINDNPYEGLETFALEVTKVSSGTKVYGTVGVVDDGTGTKYPDDNPTDGVTTDTTSLNDDRTITVTGGLTFNEASPYATFTVSAVAGAEINLTLGTTGSGTGHADISGFTTSYSEDGGTTWINYTWNGSTGNRPTVPANGAGSSLYGTVLVRVNITSEEEGGSDVYEGAETFTLTANYVTNNAITSTDTDTIVDDGTGRIDRNGDGDTSDSNEGTGGPGAGYEDDRTIDVVGGLTFNEGSHYATFTVTAIAGQTVDLILNDSTSDTATISGFTYQYSLDGGSTWSSSYAYNSNATGVTVPGTGSATGTILVRVDIRSEEESAGLQDSADVFEGAEPFSFTARYTSNTSKTDTATDTIADDGTGKIDNDGDGGLDEGGTKETDGSDTRTLDVLGGITFNEASTYATFIVTGAVGSVMNLELGNTVSTSDRDATITNFTVQYNTGSGWVTYTWDGAAGNRPTVPMGGNFAVRVLISSEADTVYEGAETFTLKASYATNASISDIDTDTIVDDGSGKIDSDGDGGADEAGIKDDDRPLVVSNVTVNEGSPYAVFEVTGAAGQKATLAVNNNTSTGLVTLQYFNGTNWQPYTPGNLVTLDANGKLLVRVALSPEQEAELDTGETFKLVAANTGGLASTGGNGTVMDDGTGDYFAENNNSATPSVPAGVTLDDDRPKAAPPQVVLPPVTPPAPPAPLAPPAPVVAAPQAFASTLQPLAPRSAMSFDPSLALVDVKTSSTGYQIPVSETAPPGLTVNRGVTDQVVESTQSSTKISLPFDAFMHSNKDAIIQLSAKQANDAPLPKWVQFDPATGVFEVTPPKGFKGKLDLKVVARDDDGREAVAIFQMFVGEQTANKPQSRSSFSEKLRMASKRPVTLVRVAEGGSHRLHMADARVMKVRAG